MEQIAFSAVKPCYQKEDLRKQKKNYRCTVPTRRTIRQADIIYTHTHTHTHTKEEIATTVHQKGGHQK
jgi:hypothetical protein